MRYSFVILSFALTLLAAPVPQGQALDLEKRSIRGNGGRRSVEEREFELQARYLRDNEKREPKAEASVVNPHDKREPYLRDNNNKREAEPYLRDDNKREAEAKPYLRDDNKREAKPYLRDDNKREAEPYLRDDNKREAEAKPYLRDDNKREAEAEAEAYVVDHEVSNLQIAQMVQGNDNNKRSEGISLRSVYNSVVGTIEALKSRGFSSSQLLEPN